MAAKPARKVIPASMQSPEPHAQTDQAPAPLHYHSNINFWHGRRLSLTAAAEGIIYTFRTQPNAWIEAVALAVVALAGIWFGISALEWGLLGLTVAVILALEAVNTAIETVVDLVSPRYHPLAKVAKDTAAGALLIAVVGSVVVAACIFGPRVWAWF